MSPDLVAALAAGAVTLHGATPAWSAWLAAQLGAAAGLTVVVTADDERARAFEADLRYFRGGAGDRAEALDEIAALPGVDVSPYAELSPDRGAIVERMATLYRLTRPDLAPRLVVTTAAALARRTVPVAELAARGRTLRAGETIDRDAVVALLIEGGWTRVPVVDEPGTFAVRGGVLDVFAPLAPHPVRIELFGDEIESLRWFEAESQRTLRPVPWVHLHPVRDTIATGRGDVRGRLRAFADELAFPTKATRRLIEQLESGDLFVGIEGLTPAFHDELALPEAYLPEGARYLLVDPDAIRRALADGWADATARHAERRDAGAFAYPPAAHLAEDLAGMWRATRRVELPTLEVMTAGAATTSLRVDVDPLHALHHELERARRTGEGEQIAPLLTQLAAWRDRGLRVALACDSQGRADRLLGVLTARGVPVRVAPAGEAPTTAPGFTIGLGAPSASMASARDGFAVLTAAELFGERTHHQPRAGARKRAREALLGGVSDFSQLAIGDYLVHQRHGVARYKGLVRLALSGATASGGPSIDTLQLEFDGGTLYLPIYRLGEVQRYVGAEGHAPRLDKLGGVTWEATTSKVKRHIRALAEELLQIYAQRAALAGHAFPPASDNDRALEASFPFDETPDQLAAIEAVLGDMEAPRAMDRLVCGDVGYGKTEVALRAIFRAVEGGKQAALLAPTTVLVEQHVRTISDRFAGFPIMIGKLSRFQTKAEQLETIRRLAEGKLDVVIGTHRLLSADVRWKDLGLLVIDEEQRFGVAHKERIKKARTQVDVLTMTATPIPRTLHLAMAGMRDLSIIATPPADRRAVRTFVSRVDDAALREALTRELARGGQAFFITPHIDRLPVKAEEPGTPPPKAGRRGLRHRDDDRSITEWADYLRALVPGVRVGIGHGGLSAEALEQVMVQFVRGELDVLVATTIVESGLDIPRANTMFVARADAFGLAQLYQLRGRIGRAKERAYCYLLVPEPEHLTDDARRRLEALQRFTELGAGFQIASQDLELRGGGELLGAKQSGSIAAVGFDAYVRMLEQAVAELGGTPVHSLVDPELTVELPGFIPDDYVPDPAQRLELYKRLSSIDTDDELRALLDEIVDRYGPLPGDVVLLGELMAVKAIARGLGVQTLEISTARVAISCVDATARAALAAGWRKLADGRLGTTPPPPGGAAGARRALLEVVARAT